MFALRSWLPIFLVLAACEPAPQGVLPTGYGEQILDDGAILSFGSGHAALSKEGEQQLVRMMPQIRTALARLPQGERRLCLAGHTDASGEEAANRVLSQRRAQAVAERMIDLGIPLSDLVVRGYGSTKPFVASPKPAEPHNRIVLIARGSKCRE
jgi:outer membrane protein OmpA-like peptidoglycan-associated protein